MCSWCPAARADSLVLGEFDDDGHTRQVLGQSLTAATLPGALRLRGALGRDSGLCGKNRVITLLGEEAQLVRVDALAAGTVPLTEQQVDRVLELLDGPPCLLE